MGFSTKNHPLMNHPLVEDPIEDDDDGWGDPHFLAKVQRTQMELFFFFSEMGKTGFQILIMEFFANRQTCFFFFCVYQQKMKEAPMIKHSRGSLQRITG